MAAHGEIRWPPAGSFDGRLRGDFHGRRHLAPDGVHYVYTRYRPSPQGLRLSVWRAATDGSEDRRLRSGSMARWSPSGRTIAYRTDPVTGPETVWLMNARTGKNVRRLPGKYVAGPLDWSPSGREILMTRTSHRHIDLVAVRADGHGVRRIASDPHRTEYDAAWSPDGRRIAVARVRAVDPFTDQDSLWTMTARGRHQRRIYTPPAILSEDFLYGLSISWQPRPR
jgi:Tol biopolymer transport system component